MFGAFKGLSPDDRKDLAETLEGVDGVSSGPAELGSDCEFVSPQAFAPREQVLDQFDLTDDDFPWAKARGEALIRPPAPLRGGVGLRRVWFWVIFGHPGLRPVTNNL
eukprot:6563806-Pyramimonas_sp.AAC.1